MKLYLVAALILIASTAFSQAETSDLPCLEIKKACESAGFKIGKSSKETKGSVKDCMKRLAEGQTLEGVQVSNSVVKACNEKKDSSK